MTTHNFSEVTYVHVKEIWKKQYSYLQICDG